ncbi:MAG: AAA family ATPase, partial [Anaerolineales bacterium]|nr:AAA family ATPase [Anaerolineales bacterium]
MSAVVAPQLSVSLLGNVSLRDGDGNPVSLTRTKALALLAFLCVEAGQWQFRDTLIAFLWPEQSEESGRNNLRVTLHHLRKRFGAHELLETSRTAVRIVDSPLIWLDVAQFMALSEAIDKHAHHSLAECPVCHANLHQLATLYHGDFLSGLYIDDCQPFAEWLFVWQERLQHMARKQLARLAEVELQRSDWGAAEQIARQELFIDSLNEMSHCHLIEALFRQGKLAEARQQYTICADALQAELGIPPAPETQALLERLGNQATALPQAAAQSSSVAETVVVRHNLQAQEAPFFGREEELALLTERLEARDYRLLTIAGPGGVGKSRLARQAGRQVLNAFRDGVFYVPCAGIDSVAEVPHTIAETIGLSLATSLGTPAQQLIGALRSREMLLIIDNIEHIMEIADLLLEIIRQCPSMVLLVTSREQINAQAEDLFPLAGLPYPWDPFEPGAAASAGVRLFGDRAHRLNKQFWLNEDTLPGVVRLCILVEGFPLALELAATWIRDYTVDEIVQIVTADLANLQADLRDLPARHRNLKAIFDYSWQLLGADAQTLLAQLSVFRAGFARTAALAVTGCSPLAFNQLIYKSFLRPEGDGRFSLHELIRQFAERELKQDPTLHQAVAEKHGRYYLELLLAKGEQIVTAAGSALADQLMSDIENIRAAWQNAISRQDAALLYDVCNDFVLFHRYVGHDVMGAELVRQALALDSRHLGPPLREWYRPYLQVHLLDLAWQSTGPEKFAAITAEIEAALQKLNSAQEPIVETQLYLLQSEYKRRAEHGQKPVLTIYEKGLALGRQHGLPQLVARLHNHAGMVNVGIGRFQAGVDHLQQARAIYEQMDNHYDLALLQSRISYASLGLYRIHDVLASNEAAEALLTQSGRHAQLADVHENLGLTYVACGALALAKRHAERARQQYHRAGDRLGESFSLSLYGHVLLHEGDLGRATDHFEHLAASFPAGIIQRLQRVD